MDEQSFEGSLVLEKLAEIGKVDDFYAAVDSDDFALVISLLKSAGIDKQTISWVIQMMSESDAH